jgi:hypothetical protein
MATAITDMLDIEFPLLAFSHCRDVVAAVTNAGGFGVLGAAAFTPQQLDVELRWIDEHVGGRPYGADVLVPEKVEGKGRNLSAEDFAGMVPDMHKKFVRDLLERHGVAVEGELIGLGGARMGSTQNNEDLLDVAFSHPIARSRCSTGPTASMSPSPPSWAPVITPCANSRPASI